MFASCERFRMLALRFTVCVLKSLGLIMTVMHLPWHATARLPVFIQSGLLDLTESVGVFDAIVGRRVLMYQADTVATVGVLAKHLRPGGVMVFQEHDTTMAPASLIGDVMFGACARKPAHDQRHTSAVIV